MTKLTFSIRKAEEYALWVGYLLILVMLACASISVVQFIQRIYAGWDGSYAVFLVIVISIERLLTFTKTQAFEFEQKIVYRVAEFITFAIILKLFGYILNGFNGFIDDLSRWQINFLTFFTGEYVFVLILLLISWLISGKFAEYLEEMRIDPLDVNWDVGILENRRQLARAAMINLILSVGVSMVAAAILTRLDIAAIFGTSPTLQLPVVNILAYFLAAFLFFSQTQFALLNGRWMWHDVQVLPGLEKSWLKAGAVFLIIVSILSFILPTSYTVNILDLIRIMLTAISQIMIFIITLFFLPIGWLFSLLRGNPPTAEVPPPPDFASLTPSATPHQIPPFLLLLQSLLFWIIFIGLILLSFSIYLRQNKIHFTFGNIDLFIHIRRWIDAFYSWFGHARKSFSNSIRLVQSQLSGKPRQQSQSKAEMYAGNLSPRQDVIRGFIRLVEAVRKEGIVRKPSQTASQFSQTLQASIPDSKDEIQTVTEIYQVARYSPSDVRRETSSLFTKLRNNIVESLKKLKSSGQE